MFFKIFLTNNPKLGFPKISPPHEVKSTPVNTTSLTPFFNNEFIEFIIF
jgi:hypothetical protein